MICNTIRSKIKNELGSQLRYSVYVRKLLNERKITNSKGRPFSKQAIVNVFNGIAEHPDIEIAIFDWFETTLHKRQEHLERLKKFQDAPK